MRRLEYRRWKIRQCGGGDRLREPGRGAPASRAFRRSCDRNIGRISGSRTDLGGPLAPGPHIPGPADLRTRSPLRPAAVDPQFSFIQLIVRDCLR